MKVSRSIGLMCMLGMTLFWSCGGEDHPMKLALTIEEWTYEFAPGQQAEIPVTAYCIGNNIWEGEVELRIQQKDSVLQRWHNAVEIVADSSTQTVFSIQLPEPEGKYELVSELSHPDGHRIRNRRLIKVKKPLDLSL